MDNKLDINVTKKKVSDENLLKTVEEALMKNELCLFMSETGTFMTTGTMDDAIEQILLLQLEAVKEIKKELSGVTPRKEVYCLKGRVF